MLFFCRYCNVSAVIAIVEVPSSPPVLARLWRNNASASTMATPEGTNRGQRRSAVTWPVIILSCCWGGGGVSLWVNSCFLMQSGPHTHNKNFYIVTLLYQLWGLCKRLCVCVHACKWKRAVCCVISSAALAFFFFFPFLEGVNTCESVFNNHHWAFPVGIPPVNADLSRLGIKSAPWVRGGRITSADLDITVRAVWQLNMFA